MKEKIKDNINTNEAYQINHGYLKCPHCDLYIHQIVSKALTEQKKEIESNIGSDLIRLEGYKQGRKDALKEREGERRRILGEMKLWRPYFYRDKITDKDISEIIKIIKGRKE